MSDAKDLVRGTIEKVLAARNSVAETLCLVSHAPAEARPFLRVSRIKQSLDAMDAGLAMLQEVVDDVRSEAQADRPPSEERLGSGILTNMDVGRQIKQWLRNRKEDVLLVEVTGITKTDTSATYECIVTRLVNRRKRKVENRCFELDVRGRMKELTV